MNYNTYPVPDDIDNSDRTQTDSDSGHIDPEYQWEETVDVSADD